MKCPNCRLELRIVRADIDENGKRRLIYRCSNSSCGQSNETESSNEKKNYNKEKNNESE